MSIRNECPCGHEGPPPHGEPLLPADYGSPQMTREMLMAEAPSIAADPVAVKAVLKEYVVLLMFEKGIHWVTPYNELLYDAEVEATKEYRASKIIKEANCV